jgi:Domain of unknown function (DUF4267)
LWILTFQYIAIVKSAILTMSTSPALPLTQTYRLLGLSVAATYIGLGSLSILNRPLATRIFCGDLAAEAAEKHGDMSAHTLIPALSARDLSIGIALGAFYYYDMPRAQAILILSGLWLCAVDLDLIYRAQGSKAAAVTAGGVGIWAWIGWELLRRT